MPVLVTDVIVAARDVLLDPSPGTTWTDTTLYRWLNDVLAAAANLKRDIAPAVINVSLAPGSIQTLLPPAIQLLEPYYNLNSGNSITKGGMTLISRRIPGWRSLPGAVDASDVTTDERSPIIFHCYPPNIGTGVMVALCGTIPSVTGPPNVGYMPVPDNFREAMVDGLCSKAFGANTRRMDLSKANFYWQKFQAGIIGGKMAQKETAPSLSDKEEAG